MNGFLIEINLIIMEIGMILSELVKERILIRVSNPLRSNVLLVLIDGAKKLAKLENRGAEEKDIQSFARSQIKKLEATIEVLKNNSVEDYKLADEIIILKEYLPKMLSYEDTKKELNKVLLQFSDPSKKIQGQVMKLLKDVPNLDMKLASKLLSEILN